MSVLYHVDLMQSVCKINIKAISVRKHFAIILDKSTNIFEGIVDSQYYTTNS